MATYYWVGGTGTWNTSSSTNWASSPGGAGGAGIPTSADDVIFDSGSNATAYTCTTSGTVNCNNLTISGPAAGKVTLSGAIYVYGNLTHADQTTTTLSSLTFQMSATTTGHTINTNGYTEATTTAPRMVFVGVGGSWTLQSNVTCYQFTLGNSTTVDTAGFNISCYSFSSSAVLYLRSSTVTITGNSTTSFSAAGATGLNAGTSTIILTNSSSNMSTNNATFYNVTFSNVSGSVSLNGGGTFNNLTLTRGATHGSSPLYIGGNIVVNQTFDLGTGSANIRILVASNSPGTQRTITANAFTGDNVDFQSIQAQGASIPWSGTSFGNVTNNLNILFTPATTKYWSLPNGGSWTAANAWALSSGGTPSVSNYPLAQDTVIFDNTGLSAGKIVTVDGYTVPIGTVDLSVMTNAVTLLFNSACELLVSQDVLLSSSVTARTPISASNAGFYFVSSSGIQSFTSNGATVSCFLLINCSTFSLQDDLTIAAVNSTIPGIYTLLVGGTVALNGHVITTPFYSGIQTAPGANIDFGTGGYINITTNSFAGRFASVSGTTPVVNFTDSGITSARNLSAPGGAANHLINYNVFPGTQTFNIAANGVVGDLNFTGFSGTWATNICNIYGNLTVSPTMTVNPQSNATNSISFYPPAGTTKTITTQGKAINSTLTFGGPGTSQIVDSLTMGSNGVQYTLTVTSTGVLDISSITPVTAPLLSNAGAILFGLNYINVTGFNATVLTCGSTSSYTGSGTVNLTYAGSTGVRTISSGPTESGALNVNIPSGSDIITLGIVKTLNFTGFSGTLTTSPFTLYGGLTLSPTMTLAAGSATIAFIGTNATPYSIDTVGLTLPYNLAFNGLNGTYQLANAVTIAGTITLQAGTLDSNSNNVSCNTFSRTGTAVSNLVMGNSTWNITGTGTVWNIASATGLTVTPGNSTIVLANTSTSVRTLNLSGQTYNNVVIGGATANITNTIFNGGSTLNTLSTTRTGAHTITFASGTTTTINNWGITGTAGNVVTIAASSTTQHNLVLTTGIINVDYLNISHSNATPSQATWYGGYHSINNGNNAGWIFSSPSTGSMMSWLV